MSKLNQILRHPAFAIAGLLLAVTLVTGCPPASPEKKGPARDSNQDPLVRERVLQRMEEIYKPSKEMAQKVRLLSSRKECDGLCAMSKKICDASSRLCELAADYPEDDEEMQERCKWATADCDTSRACCVPCSSQDSVE